MTHIAITFKFVVLTVLAFALGILISIGAANLKDRRPVPVDRHAVTGSSGIAESPNADWRLSRIHVLLSNMK